MDYFDFEKIELDFRSWVIAPEHEVILVEDDLVPSDNTTTQRPNTPITSQSDYQTSVSSVVNWYPSSPNESTTAQSSPPSAASLPPASPLVVNGASADVEMTEASQTTESIDELTNRLVANDLLYQKLFASSHQNSAMNGNYQTSIPLFGQMRSTVYICDDMVENYQRLTYRVDDWNNHSDMASILEYFQRSRSERTVAQIKFMKTLDGLRELHPDDQEQLIRKGWIEVFIVRVLMQLDDSGDFVIKYDRLNQPKKFPILIIMYEGHEVQLFYQLVKSWPVQWRNDHRIMLIVYAIVLFSTGRAHRDDVVRDIRDKYMKMLLHYFIFIYQNASDAEIAFSEISRLIQKVREVAEITTNNLAIRKEEYFDFWKHTFEDQVLKDILHNS